MSESFELVLSAEFEIGLSTTEHCAEGILVYLVIEGRRDGFGGGDSGSSSSFSSSTISLRSAQGDREGSLVTRVMMFLVFLPSTMVLGESDSLLHELVLRGSECVEKFESISTASPTERDIRGIWITPSALLHFS